MTSCLSEASALTDLIYLIHLWCRLILIQWILYTYYNVSPTSNTYTKQTVWLLYCFIVNIRRNI